MMERNYVNDFSFRKCSNYKLLNSLKSMPNVETRNCIYVEFKNSEYSGRVTSAATFALSYTVVHYIVC